MKRKRRKTMGRELTRLFRKHGSDIVIGLATGVLTNLITDRMAEKQNKRMNEEMR
jgi:Holliday junction resolvase